MKHVLPALLTITLWITALSFLSTASAYGQAPQQMYGGDVYGYNPMATQQVCYYTFEFYDFMLLK